MSTGRLEPDQVQGMFDRIAPRYDLMNQVMSVGLHHRWRERAAQMADLAAGDRALDCCTGTGDLAFALARRVTASGEVVGIDFSEQMLERAQEKTPAGLNVEFLQGDATNLPFEADSFAAATVAFGIRNIPDRAAALSEMARVVTPGGRIVILEITTPTRLKGAVDTWFQRAVPTLGRMVGKDASAYAYLPASTLRFPQPHEFAAEIDASGIADVRWQTFLGGMIGLHYGRVSR